MQTNYQFSEHIKAAYFIGIGGIGMSALARYFNHAGVFTAGYDKTSSSVTESLTSEGISVHYVDEILLINSEILNLPKDEVIVVYTPAVPKSHKELNWFLNNNYSVYKRAEVLGGITNLYKTIAVAGTHGKTSISTIISHIFKTANENFNAFLGGISKNYNSNLILNSSSDSEPFAVTEADEFDRSFLRLNPWMAVITSVDEDHLDIYKNLADIIETFEHFIGQIDKKGYLIIKQSLQLNSNCYPQNVYTYAFNQKADFYADNIKTFEDKSVFDIITPGVKLSDIEINIPGNLNIENVVAASAVAYIKGVSEENIKSALKSWTGVKRRFEYIIKTPEFVYIDDYAHHPEELRSFINSVRSIYPKKRISGIFQPHLYTRTRDFADDFAKSLDLLDKLYLLDIYPAREEPIEGVSSELIFNSVTNQNKYLTTKNELLSKITLNDTDILLTIGAGDIDKSVNQIKEKLLNLLK
jgi:UDP-N-acetylmuramate--alanine ligase